jgi:hypothetical protein
MDDRRAAVVRALSSNSAYKEIEVGFPAASPAGLRLHPTLIEEDLVPTTSGSRC